MVLQPPLKLMRSRQLRPLLLGVAMAALTLGRLLPVGKEPALSLDVQPFSIRDCEGSEF